MIPQPTQQSAAAKASSQQSPATRPSVLTAKPKDFSSHKLGAFDSIAATTNVLQALEAHYPTDDWQQKASADGSGRVFSNKYNHEFTVQKTSVSTTNEDVETFKAMLVGFQAMHPTVEAKINTDPKLEHLWQAAAQQLGVKITIDTTTPKATPAPNASNTNSADDTAAPPPPSHNRP